MLLEKEFALLYSLLKQGEVLGSQRETAKKLGISLGAANALLQKAVRSGWTADKRLTAKGAAALGPYRVNNAIIMAAGSGSRLAPLSYTKPKGLLRVRGEVLIERQIRQLQAAGISEIIVVVGYMKEQFFYLEQNFSVKIVTNPDYYRYNNTSTLMQVLGSLKNTYICSSDNYFVDNVFEPYVYQSYYAAVYKDGPTDEYCLSCNARGRITGVRIGGADSWYMMGQAYFSQSFSAQFREVLQKEYERPSTRQELWEDMYRRHLDVLPLYIKKYSSEKILEFDSLDELRAFDNFYIDNVDSAILKNISRVLQCEVKDIRDIKTLKSGMTNLSFVFCCLGKLYVYRHPGPGTAAYVNRQSEAFSMEQAQRLGLDRSFIYMDAAEGWKISHYISGAHDLDYANSREVSQALQLLRRLHQAAIRSPYNFDVGQVIQGFVHQARVRNPQAFHEVEDLMWQMKKAEQFAAQQGVTKVLCHCDAFNTNFLVAPDGTVSLIDWEYSGNDDPALDLGIFLCCSKYSWARVLEVIDEYLGHPASLEERQHYIAYAALAAFYCYAWAVYQETLEKPVGEYLYIWYKASGFFIEKLRETGAIE